MAVRSVSWTMSSSPSGNVVKMINSLKAWRKSDNALKSALEKKQ